MEKSHNYAYVYSVIFYFIMTNWQKSFKQGYLLYKPLFVKSPEAKHAVIVYDIYIHGL